MTENCEPNSKIFYKKSYDDDVIKKHDYMTQQVNMICLLYHILERAFATWHTFTEWY